MVEPYSETLRIRNEALSATDLHPLERAGIVRMMDDLLPPRYRMNPARLQISIDDYAFDANTLGAVATAVQKATAKIVDSRLNRGVDALVATSGAKRRAQLRLIGAHGNTLEFDMSPPGPVPGQLTHPVDTTNAELGLIDLCESLPAGTSVDDEAVKTLPAANLTIRSAVLDLVKAPITRITMRIRLTSSNGDDVESVLAPDQTAVLRRELRLPTEGAPRQDSIIGYLDAAREIRRVFYMETKTLGPIEGAIEPDLVDTVRGLAGRVVRIGATVTTRRGRRPAYNLVSIEPALGNRDDHILIR